MEVVKEKILTGYPNVVSYECTKKITAQMEKYICKIKVGQDQATGFFCKIPFPDKENMLKVFMTNNHVINENILNNKNEKISIDIYEELNTKYLNFNDRIKYTNEEYDTTIIEIKEKDDIKNFLEIDEKIIDDIINNKNKNDKFKDESIYIIQYPEGKLSVSYGVLEKISENQKYNFIHKCSTKGGTSGSPILNLTNNKIIAIHKEGKKQNFNLGTFLNFPIKEFIAQKYSLKQSNNNNIKKSDNNNIKKKNNDLVIQTQPKRNICSIIYNNNKYPTKIFGKDFIKNNKDKGYLIINNEKTELKEYLEINNKKLKQIEIKLYETKIITDMSYMFCGCNSLRYLPDISKWETKNATNMSYMFYECRSLKSLPDISKWETKNVTNMRSMFYFCSSLQSLPDISKWETKNVINMSGMFCGCIYLQSLPDISQWNLNKNLDKSFMFKGVNKIIIHKKFQ